MFIHFIFKMMVRFLHLHVKLILNLICVHGFPNFDSVACQYNNQSLIYWVKMIVYYAFSKANHSHN
jgi:hypothetical protein